MRQGFRPRRTEEVIGHHVDAVQTGLQQRFHVGVIEGLHYRGAGNGDFDVAQTGGIQLLTQLADQQRIVFAVFRAVRVARAFRVRVFPVDIHFAEHRELFEQFYHAFREGFTGGIRSCGFVEAVTHGPAADAHGQHQIVTLLLRFGLQIAQAAEQTFGIRLSDGFRIDVPAADGVANVNVGLEIAPRVEEGRLIFDFSALLGGFGNHIAVHPIHFMEAGDADEADDDFIVSRRGDVSQIVAATAVIFRIAALQTSVILRPVGVVTKDFRFAG